MALYPSNSSNLEQLALNGLTMLYTQPEKRALPCFSVLTSKILLMPIGAAELEKSFSTTNGRILRSERYRLLAEHVHGHPHDPRDNFY